MGETMDSNTGPLNLLLGALPTELSDADIKAGLFL